MPINQAHELVGAYKRVGLQVQFDVVYGGKHGGTEFYTNERLHRLGDALLSSIGGGRQATSDRKPSNTPSNLSIPSPQGQPEGNQAKTYPISRAEFEQLPDIEFFRHHPSDQFIVPWEVYRTGHPYLGTSAVKPHTGGHIYFNIPENTLDPANPETYPPIYAFADGIVTRVDEAFRLRPIYFPSLGTTRANVRYGIDITFARSQNRAVSFHYSIEPMIDPGDLEFYRRFLRVVPGQRVRKGDTIARMYLPVTRADSENSHIHFNLICDRQFQSPSIFSPSIVEKFAALWDPQRLREDWPIPPCMGWRLERAEDPFEGP
jgi:hypothetical protein